jgi:hypothetical protein
MPGTEMAQYGIAVFAVGVLGYVLGKWLDNRNGKDLAEVIQNNTRALEQVVIAVQSIQLSLARQEAKIDELLERARR